ncbi:hypothetical protein [Teredinibacter waterburyi]|uniref:hypothetical protein n=1 Tax=Teredinibacter waterburyi TaxID=1500538 RepID=UPI001FE88B59|nr:hypothetical protein [Teredinibacter waterburyi]
MNNEFTMKHSARRLILLAVCLTGFAGLTSCEERVPEKVQVPLHAYSVAVERYNNKGLEIIYPAEWSVLHDEAGVIADRTVAFETKDASRITLFFYKSQERTYPDLANNLEQQLRLRSSKDVKKFQREVVGVAGYKGIKLTWTKLGLGETKNEATILQLQAKPYPVFVQFHLFDADIEYQATTNLVPFLHGISFDPQGVNL